MRNGSTMAAQISGAAAGTGHRALPNGAAGGSTPAEGASHGQSAKLVAPPGELPAPGNANGSLTASPMDSPPPAEALLSASVNHTGEVPSAVASPDKPAAGKAEGVAGPRGPDRQSAVVENGRHVPVDQYHEGTSSNGSLDGAVIGQLAPQQMPVLPEAARPVKVPAAEPSMLMFC